MELSVGAMCGAVIVPLAAFIGLLLYVKFSAKKKAFDNTDQHDDDFVTNRKTQAWWGIGLSLYAGAAGTWTLTAPPETAVTGGWYAHIGYVIGCGMPWLIFLWSGRRLRALMGDSGRTSVDFVKQRYGLAMDVLVAVFSCFSMMMSLVAEYTALSGALITFRSDFPAVTVMVAVAITTALCAYFGGMPFSMFSDKAQGIAVLTLVVICYGAAFITVIPDCREEVGAALRDANSAGVPTGLILIVSCFLVEQASQTTWQRVFVARSERDMRLGFLFGVALMTVSMFIFGFIGFVGVGASAAGIIAMEPGEEYLVTFRLLSQVKGVQVLAAGFVVVLVTSTAVTIQAGLTASLNSAFRKRTGESFLTLTHCRILALACNVPPIIIALFDPPSILLIFMIVNIIASCIVPVMLLGFTPHVTSEAAFTGVCAAIFSIFAFGWGVTKDFAGGFKWVTFPDGYTWSCFATFLTAPTVACVSKNSSRSLGTERRSEQYGVYRTRGVHGRKWRLRYHFHPLPQVVSLGMSALQFHLNPELRSEVRSVLRQIKERDTEAGRRLLQKNENEPSVAAASEALSHDGLTGEAQAAY